MAKATLLSVYNAQWVFKTAMSLLNRNGWIIMDVSFPLIMASKNNYVAIPGGVIIIFDAETCIMSSTLFHEDSRRFTTKFRKIITAKALTRIIQYPRIHLVAGSTKTLRTYYAKQMPGIKDIISQWLKLYNATIEK